MGLLMCVCHGWIQAQTPAQFFAQGEQYAAKEEWASALPYYQSAYERESDRVEYIYHYALSLIHVYDYTDALQILQRCYQLDLGSTFGDELYWIGFLQFHLGYDIEAIQSIKGWLKKSWKNCPSETKQLAESLLASAEWKAKHSDDSLLDSIASKHLSGESNYQRVILKCSATRSSGGEQSPMLVDSIVAYSQWTNEAWGMKQSCVQGDSLVIVKMSEVESMPHGIGQITRLGNRCIGVAQTDQSLLMQWDSRNPNNRIPWVSLGDAAFDATNPMLAEMKGDTILFFSARVHDGHYDVYYSILDRGHWQSAIPMGKHINTSGDEISPVYHDGYLYFSSNGWPGFGGHDVYRSKFGGQPSNQPPSSIGAEVNTAFNEWGFHPYVDQLRNRVWCLWSSNATEDLNYQGACCQHLHGLWLEPDTTSTSGDGGELDISQSGGSGDGGGSNSGSGGGDDWYELPPCHDRPEESSMKVELYFHNDEPDPDTWLDQSTWSYQRAFESLHNRQATYQNGKSGRDLQDMNAFFEKRVDGGWHDLDSLLLIMEKRLARGESITLRIRGFASPRAKSLYNVHLSNRRISSLVNWLKVAHEGRLAPYLQANKQGETKLSIVYVPFGESTAKPHVSDQLDDEPKSIYSLDAALERRIELEAQFSSRNLNTLIRASKDTVDFGVIPMTGRVEETILIFNISHSHLHIRKVQAECGCTEPNLSCYTLDSGHSTELRIGFDPVGHSGVQEKCIWIFVDGQEPYRIVVRAERRER